MSAVTRTTMWSCLSCRRSRAPSLGMFMALLTLYLEEKGLRIRAKLAVTGVLSLRGFVLAVGDIVSKVRGALDQGMELVLVPRGNRADVEKAVEKVVVEGEETKEDSAEERRQEIVKSGKLTDEEYASKVRIVADLVDVLEYGIEGKALWWWGRWR